MAYTDIFGGELIFPSRTSYISITTAVDVTLQWPTEQQITGGLVVADIIDFDATAGGLNVDLPSASVTGPGNKATINNVGANAFTVRDNTGGTIQTIQPGEAWVIVLRDNTTVAGLWRTFQLGASVAVASASALAGAGIKAIGVLLNQQIDSDVKAATPITVVEGDRAKALIYTAGAGVADLPGAGAVGNDWFFMLRNSGSGTLVVTPAAGTIDGAPTINLDPNDSAFIFTDGANWFTIGLSSGSTIAFDFVSLPVPGSGDFVLSGANLNRIAYRFTGALTGARKIVVPNTTQQYWVDNSTTGAFILEIATAAQPTPVQVGQGDTAILYCDGTNVINGTTSTSVVFPITIAQGGTGANNAAAALVNLGAAADSIDLIAGDGIVGGGDLTANRTFDFDLASITIGVPDLAADFFVFEDVDTGNVNRKALLSAIGITVEDEGAPLATVASILDFVGAGVVASGAGATKTITISGVPIPVSTAVSTVLRGDGGGGWIEETQLTISAIGALSTDGSILTRGSILVSDGIDNISFGVFGGVGTILGTGGISAITDLVRHEFAIPFYMSERAAATFDQATFGQFWVRNDTPNTAMFTDDAGTDFIMGGAISAAYTRNAVIVENRTLLASASATTINNNNVLAALIADLQTRGILG